MVTPYIGEIKLFSSPVVPKGWAPCAGQLLSIQQNQALFSLIGTTYGGDGITTFALPDYRGRAAAGADPSGANYPLGTTAGANSVTLTTNNLPMHNHLLQATDQPGNATGVANIIYAQVANPAAQNMYAMWDASPPAALETGNLSLTGGTQPHDNMQPSLGINFYIALVGVYPSRS